MKLKSIQRFTLYVFLFSINFEVWDPFNTGGNFSVSKLTGFLYFVSLIPELGSYLKFKKFKNFLMPISLFFLLLTVVSFLHINSISSEYFNFSVFQNIVLLVLLVNHARKDPGVLKKAMMSFAMGSVAMAFFFYLGIGISIEEGRISLFGDNENAIGIRMCISMVFVSFFIIQNPLKLGYIRILLFFSIPVMLSLLVATGSRVAIISFSLCFVVGLILIKTRRVYTKLLIFLIGLVLGIYLYDFILSSNVLAQRLLNSAESHNLAGRDIIWKKLIPLIENNPVFGVGVTGYKMYTKKVFGEFTSPHNVILEVLCYTGFVGLLVYITFLFRVFKASIFDYKMNGSLSQLLLLIPILGLLLSGQVLVTKIGWVLFAFVIGSTYNEKRLIRKRKDHLA
ncbi:MAG: O-antigen ligase family protein [Ginsengibacter sp.]